jgi:lipopolysaccharide/colanic/teichoic acid biosynthesis glycosyltransferase
MGLNFLVKRTVDVIAASLLLLLSAPVIGLAAALIWITDGLPVFYRQSRIGVGGYPFELIKLRTMYRDAGDSVHREFVRRWIEGATPQNGNRTLTPAKGARVFKITNDYRVTKAGRFLRRFSIDELPQLINVVRGEMSLIGPRPALPYELELYADWHRNRLDAVPGITGLWQVSGRNQLSFDEMVQLDLEYLENWSFFGDVKILMRTLPVLVRGSGV